MKYSNSSDSTITSKFVLSKIKCGYLINFGLVPYYRDQLFFEVRASPIFVLSYDESMNVILKNEHLDCGVRYWDSSTGVVKARYSDSSMDGPNVNWEVLKMLDEQRQEKTK